ncbi:MAG: hypothetical protein HUK21_10005 [Fibrobacteraceae bacterium]|nr:hypothetical protein [Fibrobacteraceae bacterium]
MKIEKKIVKNVNGFDWTASKRIAVAAALGIGAGAALSACGNTAGDPVNPLDEQSSSSGDYLPYSSEPSLSEESSSSVAENSSSSSVAPDTIIHEEIEDTLYTEFPPVAGVVVDPEAVLSSGSIEESSSSSIEDDSSSSSQEIVDPIIDEPVVPNSSSSSESHGVFNPNDSLRWELGPASMPSSIGHIVIPMVNV